MKKSTKPCHSCGHSLEKWRSLCPSCGYYNHDTVPDQDALEAHRRNWIEGGMVWQSNSVVKPRTWDPLRALGALALRKTISRAKGRPLKVVPLTRLHVARLAVRDLRRATRPRLLKDITWDDLKNITWRDIIRPYDDFGHADVVLLVHAGRAKLLKDSLGRLRNVTPDQDGLYHETDLVAYGILLPPWRPS